MCLRFYGSENLNNFITAESKYKILFIINAKFLLWRCFHYAFTPQFISWQVHKYCYFKHIDLNKRDESHFAHLSKVNVLSSRSGRCLLAILAIFQPRTCPSRRALGGLFPETVHLHHLDSRTYWITNDLSLSIKVYWRMISKFRKNGKP